MSVPKPARARLKWTATGICLLILSPSLSACGTAAIPQKYRAHVIDAGNECQSVSPKLIAAQIEQESGWDPNAVSKSGALGMAQFMPETWQAWGSDGNGDGNHDPFEPADAIKSQGRLMCHLVSVADSSDVPGDAIVLALAAYNAGWSQVVEHEGVPPFPETVAYVADIQKRTANIRLRD